MPAIVGFVCRRQGKLAFAKIGLAGLGFFPAVSIAQQPQASNPIASTATPPAGQFVGSFIDPATGKQYDRYWELTNVPMPRWEQREVTERRMVPQWVTENIKTTEVRYVPTIEYQPRQRVLNRWNPMGQPQVTWDYVPITRYQSVYEVVDRPHQYQKYVEQDVKVLVPKLVEATEARMKLVDREHAPNASPTSGATSPIQNAAEIAMANRNSQATRYTTRPIDGWYSGSQAPAAMYPYSPYAYVASVPNSPYYGSSRANIPSSVAPGGYGYPNAYPTASAAPNAYAATGPSIQWPTWTSTNGPLFRQDPFRQNQSAAYAGTQPYGTASSYPVVANQSQANGTLRPSTSPMLPQSQPSTWGNVGTPTYREPLQAGLPPTVLR